MSPPAHQCSAGFAVCGRPSGRRRLPNPPRCLSRPSLPDLCVVQVGCPRQHANGSALLLAVTSGANHSNIVDKTLYLTCRTGQHHAQEQPAGNNSAALEHGKGMVLACAGSVVGFCSKGCADDHGELQRLLKYAGQNLVDEQAAGMRCNRLWTFAACRLKPALCVGH